MMEHIREDRLWPSFSLDPKILEEASRPLQGALMAKLLRKDIGFMTMRDILKRL